MKRRNPILFGEDTYEEKIIGVTYLRIISFEIYKVLFLYIGINILSKISHIFPFSYFCEIEFTNLILVKIILYSFILDIFYFILFKITNAEYSILEMIISSIIKPNIVKLLSISICFCLLYFLSLSFHTMISGFDPENMKILYDIQNDYIDEDENDYNRRRKVKYSIYECIDLYFNIGSSIFILFNLVFVRQKFDLWPKLNIGRITNFKYKIRCAINNIYMIGIPTFFIFFIILIFLTKKIFIFRLCMNYTCLFMLEYNIYYITFGCLNNFICSKINFFSKEVYSKEKLIKKEIDFNNEDNFFIIHHLNNINDIYLYPYDEKKNTKLLETDVIEALKRKILFFFDEMNRKFENSNFQKYFLINRYMNNLNNLKILAQNILDFFDFNGNKVFENSTNISIMKVLVDILGNTILFISDAKRTYESNVENDKVYRDDCIYFFVYRLTEINETIMKLKQNNLISTNLGEDLLKLQANINNFFNLIKIRKNIKLETQKIETPYQFD